MKPTIAAVLLAMYAVVAAMPPLPARASDIQHRLSWNGTWIGNWASGDGVQIVFAGDDLIAFYWHGDYLSGTHATVSPAGVVTIAWQASGATLTRDGETTAHIVIHEPGKTDVSFALKRDN